MNVEEKLEAATVSGRLLSSQRRIQLLLALREAESPMKLSMLVSEIARREAGSVERVVEEHVDRIELTLRHIHLPKLVDYGVVRYDEEQQTVELVDDLNELDSVLEAVFEG